jgi:hypothetical protein
MPWKANNPGCPCCEDDCRIDIAAWNQVAGTWTIDGDNLETASSNALAVTTNEHPEGKSTHVLIARIRGEDDGDKLRLLVAYEDSDNYLVGEIEVGDDCGYLRLFQREDGTETQLGEDVPVLDLAPGEAHLVRLCYDGAEFHIRLPGKQDGATLYVPHLFKRDVTASGLRVGMATGTIATKAEFTDVQWFIHFHAGGPYEEPNNCPECTISCTIYADAWNRADNEDLGCTWSGGTDAEIASETLLVENSGSAIANVHNPLGNAATTFNVAGATLNAAGEKIGAIIDYKDGNNYHYAEFQAGSGSVLAVLRLFKVTGGTATLLQTGSFVGIAPGTFNLSVCMVGSLIQATFNVANAPSPQGISASTTAHGGSQAGFAWDVTGERTITRVSYSHHALSVPNCSRCVFFGDCVACDEGEAPSHFKVVIEGVAHGTEGSLCDYFNATFIVPKISSLLNQCRWRHPVPNPLEQATPCSIWASGNGLDVLIGGGSGGGDVTVHWRPVGTPNGSGWYFKLSGESPLDCFAFNNTEIPRVDDGTNTCCNFSASTCKITAL